MLEDLTEEVTVSSEIVVEEEEIIIAKNDWLGSTPPCVEKWNWSFGEAEYNQVPLEFIVDDAVFNYEYEYEQLENFVKLDVILNPPLDDAVIIIDPNETGDEPREYEIYAVLSTDQGDLPVVISRDYTFYSYYNDINKDFIYRRSTDCNDNYQQDAAEKDYEYFKAECNGNWVEDENDFCNSTCNSESIYKMCWDLYSLEDRLTGHCIPIDSESTDINTPGSLKAYCDTGNNLITGPEFLVDSDGDGQWSEMEQFSRMEPFEDRNCNGEYDGEAEYVIDGITDENTCNDYEFDYDEDGVIDYASFDNVKELCFYDRGNNQLDDEDESCKDSDVTIPTNALIGNCDYIDLYKSLSSPMNMLVTYADQSNPALLDEINPPDIYKDCGVSPGSYCSKDEPGYNSGTCFDGYSGSKEDCCKHNDCWDYSTDECDFERPNCLTTEENGWEENLDPEGDDGGSEGDETEGNQQYDPGELILKDFGITGYSSSDIWVSKVLDYIICNDDDDCGGDSYEIFLMGFEEDKKVTNIEKVDSKVNLKSHKVIGNVPLLGNKINRLNIIKTEWTDSDAADGQTEDYMLFMESDDQDQNGMHNIIKMTQPFYFYANASSNFNSDIAPEDYHEDYWWQAVPWEQDTILYSFDGQVIDGQKFHSLYNYSINGDDNQVATYTIHKEYEVSIADAELEHTEDESDCVLITRVISISMIGPDQNIKIKSETYLKPDPDKPIIKEDISWSWPPLPGQQRSYKIISSIQIKDADLSLNSGNDLFETTEPINLNDLQEYPEFNFDPYQITNTFGLQRFIGPPLDGE